MTNKDIKYKIRVSYLIGAEMKGNEYNATDYSIQENGIYYFLKDENGNVLLEGFINKQNIIDVLIDTVDGKESEA